MAMASDGLGTNPGKLYLLKTMHIKNLLPTICDVYDAGDIAKLEKATQQTEDWTKKNKRAHQDVLEAKLMKLCDHIVWECIYNDPMRRTPPPSEGGDVGGVARNVVTKKLSALLQHLLHLGLLDSKDDREPVAAGGLR